MGCMYMSWLDAGFLVPLLLAVELLPGVSCGARLQAVRLSVIGRLCLLALRRFAASRCLHNIIIACIIVIIIIIIDP
jgi:hypothetical protein